MNGREKGFLLLSSSLGNPERLPLTVAQLRTLAQRVGAATDRAEDRELTPEDLIRLGYGREMAERIVRLLEDTQLLDRYLRRGEKAGCVPVSRVSAQYPLILRKRLGLDAPGCLWAKGDLSLLEKPAVALVGSRDLKPLNMRFAEEAGRQAARQGYVLVSGNARGADRTAQEACLAAGGSVICVVADELEKQPDRKRVLYLSEDVFDGAFSSQRALSRNRVIHCLGHWVFVAQSSFQKGGSWDGCEKNLRHGWSPVCCFQDDSVAAKELSARGAESVSMESLADFSALSALEKTLFDMIETQRG